MATLNRSDDACWLIARQAHFRKRIAMRQECIENERRYKEAEAGNTMYRPPTCGWAKGEPTILSDELREIEEATAIEDSDWDSEIIDTAEDHNRWWRYMQSARTRSRKLRARCDIKKEAEVEYQASMVDMEMKARGTT